MTCSIFHYFLFNSFFQEEELRASNDIKYQHLQEELHVEITAFAPPAEAYARIAYALTEVRKYLIPDSNDEIRQEQMREMEIMTGVPNHVQGTIQLSCYLLYFSLRFVKPASILGYIRGKRCA